MVTKLQLINVYTHEQIVVELSAHKVLGQQNKKFQNQIELSHKSTKVC